MLCIRQNKARFIDHHLYIKKARKKKTCNNDAHSRWGAINIFTVKLG